MKNSLIKEDLVTFSSGRHLTAGLVAGGAVLQADSQEGALLVSVSWCDKAFARADGTRLEVQGLQSTSNALAGSHVTVDTDQPLLWMTEFRDPLDD